MADANLGQIVGIWIKTTEPPHKNVLWIKTINQLTSEKAGFIWNGIEWINIQGEGFGWKGVFDLATNYKKNDVVLFNKALYIKQTDVVNNTDNPTINTDFQLFIPASLDGVNGQDGQQGEKGEKGDTGAKGQQGDKGDKGDDGVGVPTGGAAGQFLSKVDGTDYNTTWIDAPRFYKTDVTLTTNAELITINHNLNTLDVAVTVLKNSTNRKFVKEHIQEIEITLNAARIFFEEDFAGDEFTIIVQKF